MSEEKNFQIRRRAYELFLQRGDGSGDELNDWLKAEEELRAEEKPHHGPARLRDTIHHGRITDEYGRDLDNPC